MRLKIGELARRTGLTVRTLHHYDAIGLLSPSTRSPSGYRLYDRRDIERLHRIQALRRLGLSLAEVARLLEERNVDLRTVIGQQIASLDREARRAIELRDRLRELLDSLAADGEPNLPDWLTTLEMMSVYDKYFTGEELDTLRQLRERIERSGGTRSTGLVARIRALMDHGISPDSEEAVALALPWAKLVDARMGGDARLILKLDAMHRSEPVAQGLTGVDGELIDYMAQAFFAYRLKLYAKYLSPQQLQRMRTGFMRHSMEFVRLAAELRAQMEAGAAPDSAAALPLCLRWLELGRAIWGDDRTVQERFRLAHEAEPELLAGGGFSREMLAFLAQGIAHLNEQGKPHA